VGPCRLAYGTVVAAGSICRKDQLKEDYLLIEGGPRSARLPIKPGGYRNLKRILAHNYNYIANLTALSRWYEHIRNLFIGPDFPKALADGLAATLDKGISERIAQLGKLRNKLTIDGAKDDGVEHSFYNGWPQIEETLSGLKCCGGEQESRDQFINYVEQGIQRHGKDYLTVIQCLDPNQAALGSLWLQSIVDRIMESMNK
jgi:bifunctional UDP-N-acetylglucosamine pyrophosphorylase / glucosamine-1-phosphate N-acetyltransferase